ncbi:MAG: hypothetical protein B0D92_06550 [Spirochaeta sp. LUC14_002_19_P3]|nr:MAG: hypothetical protein B0D92_06550 [Spirochaeta sp. LUC14_002_19_P3]
MKNPLKLISRQAVFIIFGIAAIITLIAVIIIILAVPNRRRESVLTGMQQIATEQQIIQHSIDFGIEDFYRDSRDPDIGISYPMRQKHKIWSREEVEEFWINPAEAGITTLSEDNDNRIRESLGLE